MRVVIITAAAFGSIAAPALGRGWPNSNVSVTVEPIVSFMRRSLARGPGESYSDAILKLVELEAQA
jgi:hypothetical protein